MFESWHPYPLVRLLLPFVAGILIADNLQWSCPITLLICFLLSLTLWSQLSLSPRQNRAYGFAWLVWVSLAGTTFLACHHPYQAADHWVFTPVAVAESPPQWSGKIRDLATTDRWQRVTLDVDSLTLDDRPYAVSGRLLAYLDAAQNQGFQVGQTIHFTGRPAPLPPPSDPFGFDWRRYQYVRGVTHQVFVRGPAHFDEIQDSWRSVLNDTRQHIQSSLTELIQDTTARQLLSALMLGARDELGDGVNQAYQASGAVHILAVSGLHVGLVAGFALILFGFFWPSRRNSWMVALPTVLLVWLYIGLTGAADSAMRAGVLFSFLLLGRALSRYAEPLNLLAGAALLLILIDPWMIFHVGFQLSVMAVAGIVVLHPLIFRAWTPPDRISRFFWNLASITLSAQVATVMISLFYFHQFPTYFLLSGLFVVPLSGLLLGSGWIMILLHLLPGEVAVWIAWIPETTAQIMNALVFGIANMPGALTLGWSPAVWWALLLPFIVGTILYAWRMAHSRAFILGAIALIFGLILDIGHQVKLQGQVEWGVVQRQGAGMEVWFRNGGDGLLLDLYGQRDALERVFLPGYGTVWLVPGNLDLRFGDLVKQDATLTFSEKSLSWGQQPYGQTHLGLGRPAVEKMNPETPTILLPWKMPPWERRAWQDLEPTELINLRDHGAWIQYLE
ncbi:MAG: ComEC family competence protein [Saprospiraceae bacterium]|nr:ComEC family competence protein [Saprospiraceae bacterium]